MSIQVMHRQASNIKNIGYQEQNNSKSYAALMYVLEERAVRVVQAPSRGRQLTTSFLHGKAGWFTRPYIWAAFLGRDIYI